MNRRLFFCMMTLFISILSCGTAIAQTRQTDTAKKYDEQINQLWNQRKMYYVELISKSGENPNNLYDVQMETNNLLKYTGYCQKYALLDELVSVYLKALDTLKETDQYVHYYYPGSPRQSIHLLDKKYRMWVGKQKPIGEEDILSSSQFLYLLFDVADIITGIKKEKRTPIMKEALNKFIPMLIEHYDRWIFNKQY